MDLAIEQYEELRTRYLNELAQLMKQYGVVVRFEQEVKVNAA